MSRRRKQPRRSAEPLREESRPRPTAADLERIDAFLCDFLLPMLANGDISEEETIPLAAAHHAYGLDAFNSWTILGRAQDRIQFGVPGYTRSFTKAWARIQLHAHLLTREDFLQTREWLESQARLAGMENVVLPDCDAGTRFSRTPSDHSCVERFTRLVETMRASRMPVVPPETLPSLKLAPDGDLSDSPCSPGEISVPSPAPEILPDTLDESQQEESIADAAPPPPQVLDADTDTLTPDSVLFQAERLRREDSRIAADFQPLLEGAPLPGLLFDRFRSGPEDQAVVVDCSPEQLENLWFIGDLHGDLAALEAALMFIDSCSAENAPDSPPRVVFLGDLFDDGVHGYEVVLRLMELAIERPGRITLLAGNHDEALAMDPEETVFRSSVSPSDFTDWLNAQEPDSTPRMVAQAFVRLIARAPRALFFPDGLLAAHAGIPLSDLWDQIVTRDDLNKADCLQDFVWTRAHPRARRKIPNRTTRGCEFGREDLDGFCDLAGRILERPVRRMIRGHDHVEERYQFYPRYKQRALLTLNTLSHRLPRELFGPYPRTPCVARFRWDQLPLVYRLNIDEETLRSIYPEPVATDDDAAGEAPREPATAAEALENHGSD